MPVHFFSFRRTPTAPGGPASPAEPRGRSGRSPSGRRTAAAPLARPTRPSKCSLQITVFHWKSSEFSPFFTKSWQYLRQNYERKHLKICENLRKFAKFWWLKSREEYGTCRSRQALSNAHLVATLRFETAENEPSKVQITWYSDNLLR